MCVYVCILVICSIRVYTTYHAHFSHSKLMLITMGYTGVAHLTQVVVTATGTLVADTNNWVSPTVLTCDMKVCPLLRTLILLADILRHGGV